MHNTKRPSLAKGKTVRFLYPSHGQGNVFRNVKGVSEGCFYPQNGTGQCVRVLEDGAEHPKSFKLAKISFVQ